MNRGIVSLFAGIGGFDLAFERPGFEIVAHVEIDANCRKLLAARWPKAVALDDVRTAGKHNLPECDLITFGFPCQDLSVAGKRKGLKGERSGLYYEATRIIDELRPAWCLWENVPGLLSSEGGRDFAAVLMELDRIGYNGAWRTLDAQWFGVAQRRRRVFGLFTRLDSGAERCAEILSLRESLRGHPAPSREAGERVAGSLESRADGGGFPGTDGGCAGYVTPSVMPTLRAGASQDGPGHGARSGDCKDEYILPVVAQPIRTNIYNNSDPGMEMGMLIPAVAGCLRARDAKGSDSAGHLVLERRCFGIDEEQNASENLMGCLKARKEGGGHEAVVAFQQNTRDEVRLMGGNGEIAGALAAEAGMKQQNYVAQVQWASGGGKVHNPTAQALRSGAEHNYQFAQVGMQVRRLTPTERERLQGFPDGWTAGFSDSTRCKMLGNAVAVPVVEWIARRMVSL